MEFLGIRISVLMDDRDPFLLILEDAQGNHSEEV